MGRVVVLGSLNVDLVTRVERHPSPGETVLGDGLQRLAGGKGANQAMAAAAAGADVVMVGAVGDDDGGRAYVERLQAHVPPGDGLVLVNRRDVRRLNSVTYAGDTEPQVRLHPDDAPGGGDRVTVASAHGAITGSLVLDPTMRPGTVSVNHGRAGADVARLTSATVDVDPLTTMPLASGLPVTVTPA